MINGEIFYIVKISIVLFVFLVCCCCFMCSPQDYPECMNGFVCYAYTPEGADSIKVDLIYEGTLLETETHSTIVGLPELKYSLNGPVEIKISAFCNGIWLFGENIEISIKHGSVKDIEFNLFKDQGEKIFTKEQELICPSLNSYKLLIRERSDGYCKD